MPTLMPYAGEVVQHYFSKGLRLGIVTGSPREDVDTFFSKVDFKKYFEVVVTRSDVKKSKPNPESYQMAVDKLGIGTKEVIVFEDTANGVASALHAGLTCFAIQQERKLHHLLTKANSIFHNLREAQQYVDNNFEFM